MSHLLYCVVNMYSTFQNKQQYLTQFLKALKYDAHKMTQISYISSEAKNTLQHQFY